MGKANYMSLEEKRAAIKACLDGEISRSMMARNLGINRETLRHWIKNYETFGDEGITRLAKNYTYSKELKESAINDYFERKDPLCDICRKYGIRSESVLRAWIKKHNNRLAGKEEPKAKNTAFEERVQIVKYCLEHQNNYRETADIYNVSYQQVYTWTRKFNAKGEQGLMVNVAIKKPKKQNKQNKKPKSKRWFPISAYLET